MQRAARHHLVIGAIAIALTIAIGWFTTRYSTAFDVTANDRHSLTAGTQAALQDLNEPVDMLVVLGPDKSQRDAVRALVSRYQALKSDVSLEFINPETSPARVRDLNASPSGELILRTATREQRLGSLSERSLTGALRQLGQEGEKRIAFVTGHGERHPLRETNSDWSLVSERIGNAGLITRELSLVTEPRIGDDVDVLVIAAPQKTFFPGELASINDYVQRGGSLLWLTDPVNQSQTPRQQDSTTDDEVITSLHQLLGTEFAVDLLPGTVVDTASQGIAQGSATFVVLNQFPPHPVTASLQSPVLLAEAHALQVTPLAGQKLLPLLQTPAASWTETGALEGAITFDENTSEVVGPLALGVTIERLIGNRTQRVAIIGDADFGASQFVDNGANHAFIESLFVWLAGNDDALAFVSQPAPDMQLDLSARSIIALGAIYLVAIPAGLLVIAGVVAWRRRR